MGRIIGIDLGTTNSVSARFFSATPIGRQPEISCSWQCGWPTMNSQIIFLSCIFRNDPGGACLVFSDRNAGDPSYYSDRPLDGEFSELDSPTLTSYR